MYLFGSKASEILSTRAGDLEAVGEVLWA
jgi:hypothetical protein